MANQIVVSSGAKVRNLNDVIIGTSGVLSSLAFNVANGVPKLDVNGKILVSQLPNSVMEYQGTWNAATNTPTLVNGTGNQGDVYLCNVAGTVNFGAGPIAFVVGDQVIYSGTIWQRASGSTGTVTSVAVTESGDSLNITGSPITTSGTINIGFNGTNLQYINGAGDLTTFPTLLSSVGLSMPSAFNVSNSPLTSNGTIAITGAGVASQYIRGDGTLATLPTGGGGGSSVAYYLNGSVNQGTFGGNTYYEMSKVAIIGTGTDFTISSNGYISQFITDAGDPSLLNIPAGNWNFEMYFSASSGGGAPSFYVELYKYDGVVFTLIASSSATPEGITNGTAIDLYLTALAVPSTALTITDRLAIRVYVNNSGRTITLHTENSHLCEVITTFSTGITALNGLTAQVQNLTTGTSGTDFNINSLVDTHTFNLPVASATNTGKLSSTDWSTFNNKLSTATAAATYVPYTGATSAVNLGAFNLTVNSITIGKGAGTGVGNTVVGTQALESNTTGFANTAVGIYSLQNNTTSSYNTAYGGNSLQTNTTGGNNTAVGYGSLIGNTTGQYNTAIGRSSAAAITTGSYNTIIGNYVGTSAMNNNIILADGNGNVRYQFDGTNNIFANNVNFSSTIGNGTYTYTLPSATGTLALVGGSGVGTVTSVAALTLGTTGTDLSSTVADSTTTPVITLNVPTASATNRGALSSADWTTFNNKASTADLSNYVTLATSQTISGEKSFTSSIKSNAGILIQNGSSAAASGYLGLGANTNELQIALVGATHRLLFTNSASYIYTFPSATGTFALTSDLGSYLPLAGGTLTGALGGTSASFSSTATATAFIPSGATIPSNGMYLSAANTLNFATNTTNRLTITSAGNVGIGTSSPTAFGAGYKTLSVNGSNSTEGGVIESQTNGASAIYFGSNSSQSFIQEARNLPMVLYTNNTERMRISAAGNVGIGTSSPSQSTLGINRIVEIGGASVPGLILRSTNSTAEFCIGSGGDGFLFSAAGAANAATDNIFRFFTGATNSSFSATERMVITSVGLVYIKQAGNTFNDGLRIYNTGLNYWGVVAGGDGDYYFGYNGNAAAKINSAGTYTAFSDRNRKKDFEESTIGLNAILGLKPTLYRIKTDDETVPKQLGFIAQEVKDFIPQAYSESMNGDEIFIGLNYNPIIAALVKAIQEMNTKSEEQQALITSLQSQINELKNK
jgi:hypothetical protein